MKKQSFALWIRNARKRGVVVVAIIAIFSLAMCQVDIGKFEGGVAVFNEVEEEGVPSILMRFKEQSTNGAGANDDAFFNGSPFLVICRGGVPTPLDHLFSNFTVIRLLKGDEPPPWNATVFLLIDNKNNECMRDPYVVEAIARREHSPFLVAKDNDTFNKERSWWVHGVHWPKFSINSTKYLRVMQDRPAIITTFGEVMWRDSWGKDSCAKYDFVVYREVETSLPDCLTIHFLQGVTTTLFRKDYDEFGPRNTADILEKRVAHPNKPPNGIGHDKFCSFIIRYNSTHPVYMFNHTFYDTDALVRHMFFLQLGRYKPCERIQECPGNPFMSFKCMAGYKFHITMENTLLDGYISEKIFK